MRASHQLPIKLRMELILQRASSANHCPYSKTIFFAKEERQIDFIFIHLDQKTFLKAITPKNVWSKKAVARVSKLLRSTRSSSVPSC